MEEYADDLPTHIKGSCWCGEGHFQVGDTVRYGGLGGLPRSIRPASVEEITKAADEHGLDAKTVTRVAFFLLGHPNVALSFGLRGVK